MKRKKIILASLILMMMCYVGWIFYISEPTYIDNCNKNIEKFDYVSITRNPYDNEVKTGLVLQVDRNYAIVKVDKYGSSYYYEIAINSTDYRIIGTGTLYHKVNTYIGFNIMLITQICILVIMAILIITQASILRDLL